MDSLDIDFSILLDNVTIARSRKHITKYYDISEIGSFPTRLKPKSFYIPIADSTEFIGYREIYNTLMDLTMGVYAPTNYIQPSKIEKYAEMYDTYIEGGATLRQSNREKALQRLMTINMLKRLESCVDSFRITLNNIKQIHISTNSRLYGFYSVLNDAKPLIDGTATDAIYKHPKDALYVAIAAL